MKMYEWGPLKVDKCTKEAPSTNAGKCYLENCSDLARPCQPDVIAFAQK